MTGYHFCVSNFYRVTVHAPTDGWEHLPRKGSRSSYWPGPYKTESDAASIAEDLAHQNNYERCFCICAVSPISSRRRLPVATRSEGS